MKKAMLFCFAALLLSGRAMAQNYPLYSNYFINPFVYNPAYAASEYTQVFVHHRQQWLGVEGAPVVSALTATSMLNNTRVGLGASVSSFTRGLLSTNDVSVTYAYGFSTGKKGNLYFGLSGGAISNTIDIGRSADPDDPVFARYAGNNLQATGRAGLLYQSGSGISFGVALPQLFSPSFVDETFTAFPFSPLENVIGSIGYRKKLEGKMVTKRVRGMKTRMKATDVYAPLEMYILYRYSAISTGQFEITGRINVSPNAWIGASYRQAYGATAHAGFNVKKLSLGYSYELGAQPIEGFSTGTHEAFLSLRLGTKKKSKYETPVLRSTFSGVKAPEHHARFDHLADDPEHHIEAAKESVKKRYYVVVRAFADFASADAYKKKLINDKYNADIFYHAKDKRFYVHIYSTLKSSEAYSEVRNLKNYTKIKDAKVLVVEEK